MYVSPLVPKCDNSSLSHGPTDCTRKGTGNGILAIKDTNAGGKIKARVERGQIEEHAWVEPSLKNADQESDCDKLTW